MLENEGAHVEEHVRDRISSSMSVVSAETVGTAGSVQSNSTWNSIFRAYGWKVHKQEEPPTSDAKICLGTVKEQELRGIGGHALLQSRDTKVEDGQLERLDLVPSIYGNTKVPAWLAQDSLPPFFRYRPVEKAEKFDEKFDALFALMEEGKEER